LQGKAATLSIFLTPSIFAERRKGGKKGGKKKTLGGGGKRKKNAFTPPEPVRQRLVNFYRKVPKRKEGMEKRKRGRKKKKESRRPRAKLWKNLLCWIPGVVRKGERKKGGKNWGGEGRGGEKKEKRRVCSLLLYLLPGRCSQSKGERTFGGGEKRKKGGGGEKKRGQRIDQVLPSTHFSGRVPG